MTWAVLLAVTATIQQGISKQLSAASNGFYNRHIQHMRYWWVNQNQTYKTEVPGGFLWSPKTRADGARNQFYENMQEVGVGDVIFSFCDARIKAICVAVGRAETSPKPEFGAAGALGS